MLVSTFYRVAVDQWKKGHRTAESYGRDIVSYNSCLGSSFGAPGKQLASEEVDVRRQQLAFGCIAVTRMAG